MTEINLYLTEITTEITTEIIFMTSETMLISVVIILISVEPILISKKVSSTSVLISVLISVKKRRFYSGRMYLAIKCRD
jgi:hypothetical protein